MERFLRVAKLGLQVEHPCFDAFGLVLLRADLTLLNEIPKETHREFSFCPLFVAILGDTT